MPPERCSYLVVDPDRNVAVVGYSVAADHRGRGHATAAVRLWLELAAGPPAVGGSGVLLAGSAFGNSVEDVYGWDDDAVRAAAPPLGVLWVVFSVLAMLRLAPRRRQPGWLWLRLGAAIAVALWLAFTGPGMSASVGAPSPSRSSAGLTLVNCCSGAELSDHIFRCRYQEK